MRILAILALALCTGCLRREVPPPRVVTVVIPYVPLLPLPVNPSTANTLGMTDCDLIGNPVMRIHPWLSQADATWVVVHERIHVEQMRAYGKGCFAFADRYEKDEAFRLHHEAEAFCGVYLAQRQAFVDPRPDLNGIVERLVTFYKGSWTADEVKKAMRCWPESS